MQRIKTRPQFQAVLAAGVAARTAHFALHRLLLGVASSATGATASASSNPSDSPGSSPSENAQNASPPPANAPSYAADKSSALFPQSDIWIGAMVPKRWAKCAVTRNAIKRQIYALSAQCHPAWATAAHVVRLRSGFDRRVFKSASSDHLKLAVRTELLTLFAAMQASSAAQPRS